MLNSWTASGDCSTGSRAPHSSVCFDMLWESTYPTQQCLEIPDSTNGTKNGFSFNVFVEERQKVYLYPTEGDFLYEGFFFLLYLLNLGNFLFRAHRYTLFLNVFVFDEAR